MSKGFKTSLLMLSALSVVLLCLAWFWSSCEKVKTEVEVEFTGEARRNRFLAASRLLDRLGILTSSVESLHGTAELPPKGGTLFIPVRRSTFSHARIESLHAWVQRGGHLVVIGRMGYAELERHSQEIAPRRRDELLEPFGVEVNRPVEEEEENGEEASDMPGLDSGAVDSFVPPDAIELPGRQEPLMVSADPRAFAWELIDTAGRAVWAVPGNEHYRLLQYELGRGVITVLRSASFLTNEHIGEFDNAEFVWRLATWGGRRGETWIVYGNKVPGLLSIILAHGWMVLISLGALLIAWLLRHITYLGPSHPQPTLPRRSVMEHVDASGRYLWRHAHGRDLIANVQSLVLSRAAKRAADWRQLPDSDRHQRIAELSSLPADEVRAALREIVPANRHQFVSAIQRLERILRAL
jgi:hypothetical protein